MQILDRGVGWVEYVLLVLVPVEDVRHRSDDVDYRLPQQRHQSPLGQRVVDKESLLGLSWELELAALVAISHCNSQCL